MPEMHVHLRWPDARETRCYSPSLVIKDHFEPGRRYPMPEFLGAVRAALREGSERVRAKYGHPCSMALNQLAQIEATAAQFTADHHVEVLRFEE